MAESPEAQDVIQRVLKTLSNIIRLASCTPTKIGQSEEWSTIVNTAQEDRAITKLRNYAGNRRK